MKILHVTASIAPRYGGTSKMVLDICKELGHSGHEVIIFTTNIDGKKNLNVPFNCYIQMDGFKIRYFPVQRPRNYALSLSLAKALCREIPLYDIVHISSVYNFHVVIASYYCRKFDVPYLIHPHGCLDPFLLKRHRFRKSVYDYLFLKRDLNYASAIHYNTQEEMRVADFLKIKAPKVVIPDGVDLSDFQILTKKKLFIQKYPELKYKKIILFFSRINFKKGLDILVKAFGKVIRERDDVYLVIAGPDNDGYGTKVKKWIEDEGVLNKTLFTGMLLGEEKLAVLRDSDLFVLPSYSENFGIVVAEAMACGLPVVISNKVNIWQDVRDAGAGIVTDCDSNQVAAAISKLLDNPSLSKSMGEKGRQLVIEKYDWRIVVKQLIKVYEDIINKKIIN